LEVAMTGFRNRSLLLAAAGLMVALSVGWAAGQQQVALPGTDGRAMQSTPYGGRMPCAGRAEVVRMLREKFNESPIGHGLAETGAVAEVFTSSKGTWTIVATSPEGLSCVIGSGQSWQPVVAHDDTI
jgi:hypothetical protein